MAKQLFQDKMPSGVKTYKSRDGAVTRAQQVLGATDHRYLIVATADGRFMPVAIGEKAVQDGVQFHMAVVA